MGGTSDGAGDPQPSEPTAAGLASCERESVVMQMGNHYGWQILKNINRRKKRGTY